MHPLRFLLAYMGMVLIGAALVAPWAWHAVQSLADAIPALESLARQPFHRYVNRCLLILALAGILPLLKMLRVPRTGIGLHPGPTWHRELFVGLTVGWLSLAVVALVPLLLGQRIRNPDPSVGDWTGRLLSAVLSAGVVALIEEVLFRGALYTALRRQHSALTSLLLSSLLYAFVHFFERPPPPESVHAGTGFLTLAAMLRGWASLDDLLPTGVNLLLAGLLLAGAREATGRLWLGMGLHAGWIFWLKLYGFATRPSGNAESPLMDTGRLVDGWVATVALVATGLLLTLWYRRAHATAARLFAPPPPERPPPQPT